MEEHEQHDWNVDNTVPGDIRKGKSISSYYLPEWYDKIKDLTFETVIYPVDDCPDILPFDLNMVRYEHKSPSDSEFWGPVKTKSEATNLFYTSLRFRMGMRHGKFMCIRKYEPNLGNEYRCFWNMRLVALGTEAILTEDQCRNILAYIDSISDRIPYNRCVMDIAQINDTFIIVEFNSWETNSGAAPFSWDKDSSVFYPDHGDNTVHFKHGNGSLTIPHQPITTTPNLGIEINPNELTILRPNCPSHWLITKDAIYIACDIWLGKFDLNFNALAWKRGNYRFEPISMCKGGIYAGGEYLDHSLREIKTRDIYLDIYDVGDDYKAHPLYRYGFHCTWNGKHVFCRMYHNGKWYVIPTISASTSSGASTSSDTSTSSSSSTSSGSSTSSSSSSQF